jgi:glycosyltransferase involved in cell wall biosynthesis
MKIALLTANQFTDEFWTDSRVYQQAQALLRAGHDVVVLGTGKYGQDPLSREVKDGVQIIRCPTLLHRLYKLLKPPPSSRKQGTANRNIHYENDSSQNLINTFKKHLFQFAHDLNTLLFCLAILPEAVRQRADIYVGRGLEGLAPAYLAAQLTGADLVYDSLELWTDRIRTVPYGKWHRTIVSWMEKTMCGRCAVVIVVTQSIADILAQYYGISKPMVIPNAYHSYTEVEPSPEIRKELAGEAGQRIVIYVGFLDYGKGLDYLVDAAKFLDEGIVIAIVGDGVLRPFLENKIKENQLEDRVRLIGWVKPDELPAYIVSADLGVSPMQGDTLNYYYNIDYKPYHYIVNGLPMAISDQPEKRRLVEQYGIGAVFNEKNPQDMARVINTLLSDPVKYAAMRARSQKVGREELNWEVISRQFVDALERIGH